MKRKILKVSCFFVALVLVLMMAGESVHVMAAENQEELKTVIRVGYTENGHMIKKKDNKFTGFGVDYLNRLAEYADWKYEYVLITEANRISQLKSGNIDLLCDISGDEADVAGLILSEESCCMHYAILCAKEDDTTVFYNDYEAMNGKRIAVNSSRNMEHMMEEFARDHQITYTPVYCSGFEEMEAVMKEGEADLLVMSNQRKADGYKYVAKMGLREQYFAVADTNQGLMERIDYADRQMKIRQPFIIASLYEKYYGRPSEVLTGITREEYEFLQSKEPVRVVCDASSFPVEYRDKTTGEYCGIYADVMKMIEEESGLVFEFVPVEEYKDSWNMLKSGEADMSAGMYLNNTLKEEYGLVSSIPHLKADYTMISQIDETPKDTMKIALPENYVGIQAFVAENHPEWEIIEGKDNKECLKMVETGTVDGTLINAVFLQTEYNLKNYRDLAVFPLYSVSIPISCAFAGEDAELLSQIVTKAIRRIPEEAFENCITENSIEKAYEMTVADFMRKAFPIVLLIVILFVGVYLWILWFRERHYRHLAMTDSITGLWNGICFRKKAGEILSGNRQSDYQMISMDMEHFKYVNDEFGEKAADGVLKNIAERLRNLLDKDAIYAREMADMFLILSKTGTDMEALLEEVSREIEFDNNGVKQRYKPDIKFGISIISAGEQFVKVNEYIDRAIAARRTIKKNPRKKFAYYDQKMAEEISNEVRIEKKMEAALAQREFVVYYQPKYLLKSERVVGAEALVRWNDPEEGMIPPNAFIPIFERNGFIIQLDFFVYEEVLKTIAKWRKDGRKDIVVSVNVSRVHIGTSDFLSRLVELADRYQVPHELLELELTETVLGGKRQAMLEFVWSCKKEGFLISIDDFGSGYSSLNLLKELPVDVLKIDREFLNETELSEKNRIIVEQIVQMASKINIYTLCEGVETHGQAEFLKKIGCNMAQGYHFSRPVPLEQFEQKLLN